MSIASWCSVAFPRACTREWMILLIILLGSGYKNYVPQLPGLCLPPYQTHWGGNQWGDIRSSVVTYFTQEAFLPYWTFPESLAWAPNCKPWSLDRQSDGLWQARLHLSLQTTFKLYILPHPFPSTHLSFYPTLPQVNISISGSKEPPRNLLHFFKFLRISGDICNVSGPLRLIVLPTHHERNFKFSGWGRTPSGLSGPHVFCPAAPGLGGTSPVQLLNWTGLWSFLRPNLCIIHPSPGQHPAATFVGSGQVVSSL